MNTLVIGLGYRARNGKDTVARFINEKYGKEHGGPYDIVVTPFAAALKREVNEAAQDHGGFVGLITALHTKPGAFGLKQAPPEWVVLDKDPDMTDPLCPNGKHRKLLQWWGTEFRRAQDKNYWVKQTAAFLQQREPQVAIITDVRFPNEMFFVKSLGGETVNVVREGFVEESAAAHASENALADAKWDYVLTCENNLDELRRLAHWTFDHILAQHTAQIPAQLVTVREVGLVSA